MIDGRIDIAIPFFLSSRTQRSGEPGSRSIGLRWGSKEASFWGSRLKAGMTVWGWVWLRRKGRDWTEEHRYEGPYYPGGVSDYSPKRSRKTASLIASPTRGKMVQKPPLWVKSALSAGWAGSTSG